MRPEWQRFMLEQRSDTPVPGVIVESWRRCASYGLTTGQTVVRRVDDEDLRTRRALNADLTDAAAPHLRWISLAVAALPFHCVMLTDADGIILDSTGNLPEVLDRFALRPGFDWSEKTMGTNGIGTALAARRPVAVIGDEHYREQIHDYTCVGSPIFGVDGRILGALDLCTAASFGDPERLVLVAYAARAIEKELATRAGDCAGEVEALAVAAHEAASPISTLRMLAHNMVRAAENAPDVRELAERFEAQVKRLSTLTQGVLAAAIGAAPAPDDAPFALDDLAAEVVEDVSSGSPRAQGNLRLVADANPRGRWDRQKLRQILVNLVTNSLKYGAGKPVEVIVDREGSRATIAVRDHGPGIPEAESSRIFERFTRGHLARDQPGAGLGLWIAFRLAKVLGGELSLTPTPGGGATFVLSLPLDPDA